MCNKECCKYISVYYLKDGEKIYIHYDENYTPFWIQHLDKKNMERTFIRDKFDLLDRNLHFTQSLRFDT